MRALLTLSLALYIFKPTNRSLSIPSAPGAAHDFLLR